MTSAKHQDSGKKRRFQGWLLVILGLLGLVGLTAGGLWWYLTPAPPPPQPQTASEKKSQMESLSLTEIEEGGKRWVLKADKAEYLRNRHEIRIQGIYLEFYGPGQEVMYLRAQEGLVNTKGRELALEGDVELKRGDLTIRTEKVQYLPKERALVAPGEVVLEGPRAQVAGKDLRIDLTKKRLVLKQHRLTKLKLEKGLL
jgi:LPS export ABC transporter protein LptC